MERFCSELRLQDDGSRCDSQPTVARAELRALFPDRGVNGFPYWAVREERRSFFQAFSVGKLGCSLCCHSQGAVCHFPSSPWACDREMDDICSLAALLPKHTHTVCLSLFHTHTNTYACTHTHSLSCTFFLPYSHIVGFSDTHVQSATVCVVRPSICCLWQQNQYPTYHGESKSHK